MLFLSEFVLDDLNRLWAWLDGDSSGVAHTLELVDVNVFDLDGENFGRLCELGNGIGILEAPGDMRIVRRDLFCRRVFLVERDDSDVEPIGGLCEHSSKLAATENTDC